MSDKKLHIIQKQLIDITLPNATVALEWEASKRRDFTALINTQLERCFDDYDKNGDHLVIEKLDIDLGVFTMNNLKEEVSGRLYSKLYETLQERSKETILTGTEATERNYAETSKTDRFYTGQQGKLEALVYFLNKGQLPWWGAQLADWDEIWLTSLTENEVSRFKNFFTLNDEKPIRRLATQFKDNFIEQLLQRLGITEETAQAWQWLELLLKNPEGAPGSTAESSFQINQKVPPTAPIRVEYWTKWILYAVGKGEIPSLHKLFNKRPEALEITYSVIIERYEKLPDKIPSLWKEEISDVINQSEKRKAEEEATIVRDRERQEKTLPPEDLMQVFKDKEVQQTEEGILERSKDILSKPIDKKSKTESEGEAVFVTNAGLIILHPFLPELFRHCGWLEKNKFVDEYTQTMAAYALHILPPVKLLFLSTS